MSSQVISQVLLNSQISLLFENLKLNNINWNMDSLTGQSIMNPRMYSNCSSSISQSSRSLCGVYSLNYGIGGYNETFRIPNFYIDCFPLDGRLASTLECYYNLSCMNETHKLSQDWHGVPPFTLSAINSSCNIPTENIETIANKLMVDSWSSEVS